jgi:hypothetical protein
MEPNQDRKKNNSKNDKTVQTALIPVLPVVPLDLFDKQPDCRTSSLYIPPDHLARIG